MAKITEKPSILVIDDMAATRKSLQSLLGKNGFQVVLAHNGADGLVRLKESTPDLIIVDQMMPEVDGLTFVKAIKKFRKYTNIPVIMLTAVTEASLQKMAEFIGISQVFVKGDVDPMRLVSAIRYLIGQGLESRPIIEIYIDPGNASKNTLQDVFEALSDLQIAAGGEGLEFKTDGNAVFEISEVRE